MRPDDVATQVAFAHGLSTDAREAVAAVLAHVDGLGLNDKEHEFVLAVALLAVGDGLDRGALVALDTVGEHLADHVEGAVEVWRRATIRAVPEHDRDRRRP